MSWYETAFRSEYLALYPHRDEASAEVEAKFAAERLGLEPGQRVLDLACGNGRHARAFAQMGLKVVGYDLSRDLLAHAQGAPRVRGDMRSLPFAGSFDGAASFFTSFGYFDDAGNRRALGAAAAALRPGAGFLLDYLNATRVRAFLVPQSEEEHDGYRFTIRRRIEDERVVKEVDAETPDGPRSYRESVALYNHADLVAMLHEAGLRTLYSYGDFGGTDYTTDDARCILLAQRE